jgi:hypothetical protein
MPRARSKRAKCTLCPISWRFLQTRPASRFPKKKLLPATCEEEELKKGPEENPKTRSARGSQEVCQMSDTPQHGRPLQNRFSVFAVVPFFLFKWVRRPAIDETRRRAPAAEGEKKTCDDRG